VENKDAGNETDCELTMFNAMSLKDLPINAVARFSYLMFIITDKKSQIKILRPSF
jgi:hypothetical protein